MSRKGESITLSLTTEEKAELEAIALQHNCKWGEKPNVSALLKAIAAHKLTVHSLDSLERRTQAMKAIGMIKQGLDELGNTF